MSKTVVFICGTNCSGKTTVAKALQEHYGGIARTTSDTTFCKDSGVAFAGIYREGRKHGGVDALNRTDTLAGIIRRAFLTADTVFCEGSYLDTFGQNLCNALFAGQRCLYVFLYCNCDELARRNQERLSKSNRGGAAFRRPRPYDEQAEARSCFGKEIRLNRCSGVVYRQRGNPDRPNC